MVTDMLRQDSTLCEEKQRMAGNSDYAKWRSHTVATRNKHGLPAKSTTWQDRPGIKLFGVPASDRMRNVIEVGFSHHIKKHPRMSVQENMKGLYANVGMSVARMPFTRSVPTPTTSVVAYSYEHDRVISALGMMRL